MAADGDVSEQIQKAMNVSQGTAGTSVVWMTGQEFQSSGLLWHVNQAILWPLGLALSVERDDSGNVSDTLRVIKRVRFESVWSGATEDETKQQAERLEAWMRSRITED